MKIINLEPEGYSSEAKKILQSAGIYVEKFCSPAELTETISGADVAITRFRHQFTKDILQKTYRLKIIATAVTGLDHIDEQAAKKQGITIVSLRGETKFLDTIHATAEHTWGLLLALVRNIDPAVRSVKQGAWDRDLFIGHELAGKRLGIVGLGRIGKKIARYGLTFGMKVSAYDPFVTKISGVTRAKSLRELLSQSDVVTMHVPFNEKTRGLLGRKEIAAMPPGSWLINTSRGALIDERALLDALTKKHLKGAALDVLADEGKKGFLQNSSLRRYAQRHSNLLITPHIGGATRESWEKTEIFIAQKIVKQIRSL